MQIRLSSQASHDAHKFPSSPTTIAIESKQHRSSRVETTCFSIDLRQVCPPAPPSSNAIKVDGNCLQCIGRLLPSPLCKHIPRIVFLEIKVKSNVLLPEGTFCRASVWKNVVSSETSIRQGHLIRPRRCTVVAFRRNVGQK